MNKTISIWRPFEDLVDMARDIERGVSDLGYPTMRDSHYLNVNVDIQGDDYIIKAEVPGISEDDININFENKMVTIEAEYKEESENAFKSGKYARSFSLPDIDAEKATASLKDGILTIMLPKAESAKARKIEITK